MVVMAIVNYTVLAACAFLRVATVQDQKLVGKLTGTFVLSDPAHSKELTKAQRENNTHKPLLELKNHHRFSFAFALRVKGQWNWHNTNGTWSFSKSILTLRPTQMNGKKLNFDEPRFCWLSKDGKTLTTGKPGERDRFFVTFTRD